MFWHKSVVLFGLLAGLASTTPLLVKRVNPYDAGFEDDVYFRADARGHAEIKKDQGFKAWAKTKDLPPNLSLWDHCKVKDAQYGFGNLPNDGFVGMSSDVQVTLNWVTDYIEETAGTTTIYRIAQDRNLLACADILKGHNSIDSESEYVAIGEIPWEQVMGWFDTFVVRGGQITDAKWTDNPDFNKAKFQGKPYGTDESKGADPKDFLPLAGFPKNDKRWKEKPWNTVTPANCGSKKRSIFDDFEDEETQLVSRDNEDIELEDEMQLDTRDSEDIELVDEEIQLDTRDSEDIELVTGHSEDMQLVPRARGRSKTTKKPATKKPTRKTPKKKTPPKSPPKKTPPKKTPPKKTPPKKTPPKKTPPKKTCSAAAKKANGGVCPKKAACTAAQKKANGGVCPTKTTCTAAQKKANGGVCPTKTTCTAAQKKANGGVCPKKTTCTAAQKKANGGVCPATCSAAIKKKNGGVCPATCSAAVKKQNGGVCPTCTAAEKKKNGGQCPPKSCPLPKTNKQLAQDYYKMYKAGTLGKGKKSTTKTGGKKKGSV